MKKRHMAYGMLGVETSKSRTVLTTKSSLLASFCTNLCCFEGGHQEAGMIVAVVERDTNYEEVITHGTSKQPGQQRPLQASTAGHIATDRPTSMCPRLLA